MSEAKRYTISIQFAEFDGEGLFEATVREFPDIVVYAETHSDAYNDVVSIIDDARSHILEQGRVPPEPIRKAETKSGRIPLRLPKSLHTTIADLADAEGTSLNQFLLYVISGYVGRQSAIQIHQEPITFQRTPTATRSETLFSDWLIQKDDPVEVATLSHASRGNEPIYIRYINTPLGQVEPETVGLTAIEGGRSAWAD